MCSVVEGGQKMEDFCSNNLMNKNSCMEEDSVHTNHDEKESVYAELWHACAGPFVTVPHVGEMVFYFPQGHLEQVEAYTNQETNLHMPKYNLPSEILCRVVNVELKAELDTDEVFAQVTLLPETTQQEQSAEEGTSQSMNQRMRVHSFCKTLTASDTSTHGGFSVLKRHADDCLPPLDMSQQPPSQELVVKDLLGVEWRFRHIYRGQPKRHLLTSGWSTFVSSKKLVAGDTFIFLRGENGELRVGVRRAKKLQKNASASVITGHSMQLGVLATASHAISTGTMFSVFYQPRTSPSEFMIPYDQYMKAVKSNYSVGMTFKMRFEGEDGQEQRLAGTIVGIDDVDPMRWPGSKWRCLKLLKRETPYWLSKSDALALGIRAQWDDNSATILRSDRVFPWNIELDAGLTVAQPSLIPRSKKACIRNPLSSSESCVLDDGLLQGSAEPAPPPPRQPRVLQGQEINSVLGTDESENTKKFWDPTASSDCYWLPQCPTENSPSPNAGSSTCTAAKWVDLDAQKINSTITSKKCNSTCMLFGVDLVKSPVELIPSQVAISSELKHQFAAPAPQSALLSSTVESDQLLEPSKIASSSGSSVLSRFSKDSPVISRSCTKVHKYGTALGRSVDLTRFNGYDELLRKLDQLFEFSGKLLEPDSAWNVIYADDEGDMMLIGDYPWLEFIAMVQRMFIWPKGEVDKLNSTCSLNSLPL